VLPCTHAKLRAVTTQRPAEDCRPGDYLSMDVEQDLTRLIRAEIEMHTVTEALKQRLEAAADYDDAACYSTVDNQSVGFIDVKCVDNFFRRTLTKGVDYEDFVALIRRLDLDSDGRLREDEFLKGVIPQEPYSKMLLRTRQKQLRKKATYPEVKFDRT
jgi:hypothetical protein